MIQKRQAALLAASAVLPLAFGGIAPAAHAAPNDNANDRAVLCAGSFCVRGLFVADQ